MEDHSSVQSQRAPYLRTYIKSLDRFLSPPGQALMWRGLQAQLLPVTVIFSRSWDGIPSNHTVYVRSLVVVVVV